MAEEAVDIFGLEPEVESLDQIPYFLRAIRKLQTETEDLQAKAKKSIQKIEEDLAEKLLIVIDGEPIARPAYAEKLTEAVCNYARENWDELFTPKRQTWKCEAGAVSTKTQPEKVVIADPNTTEDDVIDGILETSDLLPELDRIRADFAEAFPFIRIKLELDKASILKAFQARQLTADELSAKGLKIDRNPPKFSIKIS